MPRRSIRCVVDLDLHAVTAPGCWLPSKEDCYLSVSFFSQYKNTELLNSVFPIPVNEHFRFEKTYFTALEAEEVIELLEDELVVIELLQMSEYSDGAVHLATYTNNVRDFLYPFETYRRTVHARDRDIFLDRTVAFPGISPKLEFSSKILVKESYSDELDALEDAIDYHKNTLKRLRKAKLVKRRPRSCSPRRRKANSFSHVSSSGYGKITNRSDEDDIRDNSGRYGIGQKGMDDFGINYNGNPNNTKPRPGTKHLMPNGPPIPDARDYRTFTRSRPSGYILPHLTDADVDYSQDSDDDNESFVTEDNDVIPAGSGLPRTGKSSKRGTKPKTSTSRPTSSTRPSRPRTRSRVSTKAKPSSLHPASGEGKLSTPRRSSSARPSLKRRANSTPRSQGLNSGRSNDDQPLNTPRKLSREPLNSTRYPRPPSRERPSLHGRNPRKNMISTPRLRSAERPSATIRQPLKEIPVNSPRYPFGGRPVYSQSNPHHKNQYPDYPPNDPNLSRSPVVPSRRQISRQRPLSTQSNPSGVFHTIPLQDPTDGRPLSTPRQPRQRDIFPQDAGYPRGPPYDSAMPHYQGNLPYDSSVPQYSGESPYGSAVPQYPGGLPYSSAIPQYPGGPAYTSTVPTQQRQNPYNAAFPQVSGGQPYNTSVPHYPGAVPHSAAQYPGGLPYNTSVPGHPGQLPQVTLPGYPGGMPYSPVPKQAGLPYTVRRKPQGLPYTNRQGGPQISPRGVTQIIDPTRCNRSLSPKHLPSGGGRSPRVRINTSPSPSRSPSTKIANHKLGRNVVSHYAKEPYSYSLSRSPSPTLQQRIEDMNLTNDIDGRPPFVVRKLDDSLIGRMPVGLGPEQIAKSKPHKCVRTNKYKTVDFDEYYSLPGVKNRSPRPKSSLSRRSPSGVLYGFDPDDEVANLTSRGRSLPRKRDALSPTRRYRSPSPHRITPSYSPPRSRRDLYDRVPNVRFSRDLSPDDIYYGRDVSPNNSLNSDDDNNRKRPGSNPNKTFNIKKKTPPTGLDEVDSNKFSKTPKANKNSKLPSARRQSSSPHSKLRNMNKPLISAERSSPGNKSPHGTRRKIPSELNRHPYANDIGTARPDRRMSSPYASDTETPRPRRRAESPYASDTETPRPPRYISPYASDSEACRPRRRITSPYASDPELGSPRRQRKSPYANDNKTPRGVTSPYDTETDRPHRRVTSPYASDTQTPGPRRRVQSPYDSDIETPRPRRRTTSPYARDIETRRPGRHATSLYSSDTETPGPCRRVKSPFASDTETGSRRPRRTSPYASDSKTPRQNLLKNPYEMDIRSGSRGRGPLSSDSDIPSSLRGRTSPDLDLDKPYHRSRYTYPQLSSDQQDRPLSPYASDSALLPRYRNPREELDSPCGPSRRPYASDTERPSVRDTHPIDLDKIQERKRSPIIDDMDGPLELDRRPNTSDPKRPSLYDSIFRKDYDRQPYDDYLGSRPSRHSHSPGRGKPSYFDRHTLDDNPERPYRYGGYSSPFADIDQLNPAVENKISGREYRQSTKTLTEDFNVGRRQERTIEPLGRSRYPISPDSGLSDEFDRKVGLSDNVDDVGSITITEGSLDINISDSDIDIDIPRGPVTREDKYKVSRTTKNKKLLGTKKKLGKKVKSSIKKSVDKDSNPDVSKGTTTKSITKKITKSTTITRTVGGKKSLGSNKKAKLTPRNSKMTNDLTISSGKLNWKQAMSKKSVDDLDMDHYRRTHSPPPYSSPQHHRSSADILSSSHKTTRADVYHNTPENFRGNRSESPLPSRPVSPVLNRTRFRDRFSEAPFFSAASKLSERAVERSHRYRYPTHDTLDDLALDTSLAKYRSQVHINNGHYWTERAAELSGKSHRDLFNSNINKIYNRLYKQAENNRS